MDEFETARLFDWNTWLSHNAVDLHVDQDMGLTGVVAVQMRAAVTDKNVTCMATSLLKRCLAG